MAKQYLLTFAIVAIVVPRVAFAAEFIVGGDDGWTADYDYAGWAKGKEFRVGDKLVFKYTDSNVYQVTEESYTNCILPLDHPLTSGEDTITLVKPGPNYFICGLGLHCKRGGEKLFINVKNGDSTQDPSIGAPSQSSESAPSASAPNRLKEFGYRLPLAVVVVATVALVVF